MMMVMKRFGWRVPLELVLLIVGAGVTRLIGLAYPRATVFDEVYFSSFAASYFRHAFYFDIHPPLGKLLLAGTAWLPGVQPSEAGSFEAPAAALRLVVALAGVCIVPLCYGIVRRLSGSRLAAGLCGAMVLLDGALIVESRLVLIDSFLLCFGLAAVYCVLRWRERMRWRWLLAAGVFAGAAVSVKWTGLSALGLVLLVVVAARWRDARTIQKRAASILMVLGVSLLMYVGAFGIHFRLLDQSGPGDAFLSTQFQSGLRGSAYYDSEPQESFVGKLLELNRTMYVANQTLDKTHPYSSPWYTWPMEKRPVYLWKGDVLPSGSEGNLYLLGNPFVWWLSALSVVVAMMVVVLPRLRRQVREVRGALAFLLVGYFINWLPFAKIGRVMFLYHYLFSFIFATMILAILVAKVVPAVDRRWFRNPRMVAVLVLLALGVGGFAFFAPLTYGIPLSQQQLQLRQWLPSWR